MKTQIKMKRASNISMKLLEITAFIGRIAGIVAMAISVFLIALLLVNPNAKIIQQIDSDFETPVKFNEAQKGKYVSTNGEEYPFEIDQFRTKIPIGNLPRPVQIVFFLFLIINGYLLYFCFTRLWKLLKNITKNNLFHSNNLNHLKWIGRSFIGLYIFDALGSGLLSVFVQSHIQYDNLKPFSQISLMTNSYLIMALVCWALVVVFEYGQRLKSENELTI